MTTRRKSTRPSILYVRLSDPDLRPALDARAEQERRTVRAVVEAALRAYLATPVIRS